MDFPQSVIDEDGNIYHLFPEPIGQGGQGIVFRTRTPNIAVKLLTTVGRESSRTMNDPRKAGADNLWKSLTQTAAISISQDETDHNSLRKRIEEIRLLPIPDVPLAKPLCLLRDHVGYTMRLLTDMVPIRNFIGAPGSKDVTSFYIKTGGLRRRLEILARLASTLVRLHGVPLVYADLSPNNVFISEDTGHNEVWLIDLDNLSFLSSQGPSIHTVGFGAPEVVSGRSGVTTLSDSYSFAVLAFYILTQTHPFLGRFVDEADWDADDDREQMAYAGEIPWVDDPDDASNRTTQGLPRELVLSRPLVEMFQRTFGAGRKERNQRPGMSEWEKILWQARDRSVSCANCRSTFDITAGRCHFCNAALPPSFFHLQFNRWDPELDESDASAASLKPVGHLMLDAEGEGLVFRRSVQPLTSESNDTPALRLRKVQKGLVIEALSADIPVYIRQGETIVALQSEVQLPLPIEGREIYLHFGDPDRPHRMGIIRFHGATK